ncbi:unannotated protein [freshwater metagenome]|uniref:Unannotated protein n=1 Tax=freshwater metagenome TaxID=449393 RepID=A0A6J6MS23_9ZZZZ
MQIFFISSQVIDFVENATIHNLAVWSFDESECVDTTVGCQRTDQTNVWTFRGFNWAHAAVVRWVNVADFEACALT